LINFPVIKSNGKKDGQTQLEILNDDMSLTLSLKKRFHPEDGSYLTRYPGSQQESNSSLDDRTRRCTQCSNKKWRSVWCNVGRLLLGFFLVVTTPLLQHNRSFSSLKATLDVRTLMESITLTLPHK